jgi:hypothetical protein
VRPHDFARAADLETELACAIERLTLNRSMLTELAACVREGLAASRDLIDRAVVESATAGALCSVLLKSEVDS